jgi:YfiH family protein
LRSTLLDEAGFLHAFPTRQASEAELLNALGSPAVAQIRQVHGARAVDALESTWEEADAIVGRAQAMDGRTDGTATIGKAVGVRVADCVPVLVADEASGDVVAIHAGWRGVVLGVVRAGVERLKARAAVAAIGPCIGACCFEVGDDVARQIGFVVATRGDKARVDLRFAVRTQLLALGVKADRIEDVPGCTRCEATRFHSFRRDGSASGRMLAAIAPRSRRCPPRAR